MCKCLRNTLLQKWRTDKWWILRTPVILEKAAECTDAKTQSRSCLPLDIRHITTVLHSIEANTGILSLI